MGRVAVNRLLKRLLTCQALAVALFARGSFAEDNGPASDCPRPADVLAGLAQVVASWPATLSTGDIVVHDHGESWSIEVRGRTATYPDASRDCVERARVATVFAALAIEPVDAEQPLAEAPAPLPPSPQPLASPSIAAFHTVAARPAGHSWRAGFRSTLDHFSGGTALVGGDVFAASSWGRWFVAEVGAGGRVGADQPLHSGQVTTRAGTVTAAAGLALFSRGRLAGSAVVAQAQAYLVRFDVQQSGHPEQTALLDGWTVAVQPRLALALTRRLALAAAIGVGYAVRPIVIREQGITKPSLSGLVLSAHVGGDFSF